MASCPSLFEENLSCPVCRDVFRDPVLLLCSHSFCRLCLEQYWQYTEFQTCPLCRVSCPMENPPSNLALKNLVEAFKQERYQRASASSELLCGQHQVKLLHFCMDDQQPVCLECQNSKTHSNHCIKLLEEAAVDLQSDLKDKLQPLKDRLNLFRNVKLSWLQTEKHIKRQAQHTESLIKKEFEELHKFLLDEEKNRIAALREEEEQKSLTVKAKMAQINRDILSLSDKVTTIEDGMDASAILFLQNYKATVERTQDNVKDPETLSGALIDVAKHLANLKFRVWEKMQNIVQYIPVIFDPNTAHPCLRLSDDLTEVTLCNGDPQLPANPERFDDYASVIGSRGFESGTHSWDIEVGDNTAWAVGVISESVCSNREKISKHGLWHVGHYKGQYGKGMTDEMLTPLQVNQKLQKVRVLLDCDGGQVSFFDPINNTHIHTFNHTFTEPVYPYVCIACPNKTVKMLPV